MNKKILILIVILISVIFAENNAVDFLETGLSARGLALGNCGTALAGDIDYVYFNPAVLADNTDKISLSSSGANNFEEVERKNIGCSLPGQIFNFCDQTAVYGLNFSTSFVGNIYKTKWDDDRPVILDSFNSEKNNFSLTYSKQQDHFWSYGLNIKKYSYTIDSYFANAWGLDAGVLYRLPENILDCPAVAGITLHNIGRTNITWSTGHSDTIPMRINIGLALYKNIFDHKLMVTTEIEKDEINKPLLRAGAEYWLVNNMLALRGGIDNKQLAYGLGLYYQEFGIDYGQTELEDLGFIKRVTLSYSF